MKIQKTRSVESKERIRFARKTASKQSERLDTHCSSPHVSGPTTNSLADKSRGRKDKRFRSPNELVLSFLPLAAIVIPLLLVLLMGFASTTQVALGGITGRNP